MRNKPVVEKYPAPWVEKSSGRPSRVQRGSRPQKLLPLTRTNSWSQKLADAGSILPSKSTLIVEIGLHPL